MLIACPGEMSCFILCDDVRGCKQIMRHFDELYILEEYSLANKKKVVFYTPPLSAGLKIPKSMIDCLGSMSFCPTRGASI
jgi:hypothetical protein